MPFTLEELIKIRHDFHQEPELGFQESKTKEKVAQYLKELGLEVSVGAGVVGILRAGQGNRAIGLRADMDALPIDEKSTHNYPSKQSGVMHACGHDGHMTMLLGAAAQLSQNPNFDGTVFFIFQPNEENGLGALAMLEEGFLSKFPIEEVYGIHNLPGAPLGQVSTRIGIICSSESLFEIKIEGQGGHASMPHLGRDAITIGAELVQSLQTIVARKLAPASGAVVSVTEFISDGARNILPGRAILKGDVRARNPEDRDAISKFMSDITKGIAQAHGVKISMSFNTEFVEVINSEEPTQAAVSAAQKAGFEVIANREPMSFSEDFAHFSNEVPGCFMLLGNGETGAHAQPLHADDYDFNDDLIAIGSKLWSEIVYNRLPLEKG